MSLQRKVSYKLCAELMGGVCYCYISMHDSILDARWSIAALVSRHLARDWWIHGGMPFLYSSQVSRRSSATEMASHMQSSWLLSKA